MRSYREIRKRIIDGISGSPDSILISDMWIDKEVERIMSEEKKMTRSYTDWEKELKDDEVVEDNAGKKIVLLRGLQRLARIGGIRESYPESLSYVMGPDGKGVIQCIYITRWDDGGVFGATADANKMNLNPDFVAYPTTIAESRAEGRALKKALGITMLTAEEIDISEGFTGTTKAESGKADSAQVRAIERLIEELGTEVIDVISAVINDGREVLDLADLTPVEAIEAMRYLNEQRSSSTKRDARKAALQKKIG